MRSEMECRRFFCGIFAVIDCRLLRRHPLPLPLGEVAERSEVGEGKQAAYRFFLLAALAFAGLHSLSPANPAAAE